MLDVNLRAPIVLAQGLLPRMIARHSGQLVFISSLSGKAATPNTSLYNASKFGLRGFAAALRADLHGSGVGVTTVFPGFISDAGMFADAEVELPTGVGTRTPEQVADAVVERDRAQPRRDRRRAAAAADQHRLREPLAGDGRPLGAAHGLERHLPADGRRAARQTLSRRPSSPRRAPAGR